MGERQTWHTYIPYTDRIDYLGGVTNNLPYVLTVEKLCGIEVPERAQVIRVMLCEFFRIASHLVFYGTFAQDIGALSPVFYMFEDRERSSTPSSSPSAAARMHPNWFRIGGVAEDLPHGWEQACATTSTTCRRASTSTTTSSWTTASSRRARSGVGGDHRRRRRGVGRHRPQPARRRRALGLAQAAPVQRLRAGTSSTCPVGTTGDCYDRTAVHVEEIRQSLRIIRQCLDHMPSGPYKAYHPLTTPPLKEPRRCTTSSR